MKHHDYTKIDNAICEHLEARRGHPTNSYSLCHMAAQITGGKPWRLVDRRMQAMRKAGRLDYDKHTRRWQVNA